MLNLQTDNDTVCALATPAGQGAIAVVRISGSQAFTITKKVFPRLPDKPESHKIYFGMLKSADGKNEIDEVLVSTFWAGKSFTGEESVEISCHGNNIIVQELLKQLVVCGARPATRGEFTYRAFMNGKIDLVQAESILSLIESKSESAKNQALRQLKGKLSQEIEQIESDIIWCLANIEAGIDFSTEGIEVVDKVKFLQTLGAAKHKLSQILETYRVGKTLKDGFRVSIVGRPNAGKSSLLNFLIGEEKAIVTDIEGTTRDPVEGELLISGQRVVLTDTAGLRSASDAIEKIGVQKSYSAIKEADLNFYVFDLSQGLTDEDLREIENLDLQKTVLIGNKIDKSQLSEPLIRSGIDHKLRESKNYKSLKDQEGFLRSRTLFVSTRANSDSEKFKSFIKDLLVNMDFEDQTVLASARQFENLSKAKGGLELGEDLVKGDRGFELAAIEIKTALIFIQETLGKRFDDEIMDRVFKEFCIGK